MQQKMAATVPPPFADITNAEACCEQFMEKHLSEWSIVSSQTQIIGGE